MDSNINSLLTEMRAKETLSLDKAFGSVQDKVLNIFGPLSQVWEFLEIQKDHAIEQTSNMPEEEFTQEVVDMLRSAKDCARLMDMTVTMLGQAFNTISYYRRRNALSSILKGDKTKVKNMMKENKEILQEDTSNRLFGEKFDEKMVEFVKLKKKSKEFFNVMDNKTKSSVNQQTRVGFNQSFRGGPLPGASGRGQNYFQGNQSQSGSNRIGKSNFFFITNKFSTNFVCSGLSKSPPISEKPVSSQVESESTTCRNGKIFLKELGKTDKGPLSSGDSSRLQNSIYGHSTSNFFAQSRQLIQGRKETSGSGNRTNAVERCNYKSETLRGPVSQQHFHSSQKRWGKQTCDKSEIFEQFHSLPSFQDGGVVPCKRTTFTQRLDVQSGFEGCLLLYTHPSEFTEILTFRMGRFTLSIPQPVFWPISCSTSIHEIIESPNNTPKKITDKTDNIFGRHSFDGFIQGGIGDSQGYIDFSISTSGFRDQCEKVRIDSIKKDRIFRGHHRFSEDGNVSIRRKSSEDNCEMLENAGEEKSLYKGSFSTDRDIIIHNNGNPTSSSSIQVSTKTSNSRVELLSVIRETDCTLPPGESRNRMVDKQHTFEQRKVSSLEATPVTDKVRCLKGRVGSLLPGKKDRGTLVRKGKGPAHKYPRIKGSELCHIDIHPEQESSEQHSHSDGQHDCPLLLSENGRDKQSGISENKQANLELFNFQGDHTYCRTPSRDIKQGSGFRVQKCEGLQRVETRPCSVSETLSDIGIPRDRPLCVKGLQAAEKVLFVENRSIQSGQGRIPNKLVPGLKLCFPPVQSDRKGTSKGSEGTVKPNSNNTGLANSVLVPKTNGNGSCDSSSSSLVRKPFEQPKKGNSSIVRKPLLKTPGMESFRKKLSSEGISERASNLISNARRVGTRSNYESAWRKFDSWCSEKQIDPTTCDVSIVLDYLAHLFDQGYRYNYIAAHRSAISAYHEPIKGILVGKHTRVSSLLTGIFNERPPLPRYSFVWDVEIALKFIKTLPIDDSISDKLLTYKLVTLLSLLAASRVSEITNLDIDFLLKQPDVYVFTFSQVSKTWKPGQKAPTMEFKVYDRDVSLCVCRTIDLYLKRTESRRGDYKQLLISIVRPYHPVKSCTVSRWLVDMLGLSGIDTKTFKAHSTRAASTSKASSSGISLTEIVKRGKWKSDSTFRKFYHKNIVKESDFQGSILATKKL